MRESFFKSLNEEQQARYREFGEYWRVTYNPVPEGLPIKNIIIPTGDGWERAVAGVELFNTLVARKTPPPKIVITGENGSQKLPATDRGVSAVVIADWIIREEKIPREFHHCIVVEGLAKNTAEQARNVAYLYRTGLLPIGPSVAVVSRFHLPRNVATFVQAFNALQKYGIFIPLFSHPAENKMSGTPFGTDVTRRVLIDGEMIRMRENQKKGDVASFEDLVLYQQSLAPYYSTDYPYLLY